MGDGRGFSGKLKDPAVRHERAKRGGEARTTLDYHVKQVVDRAPELSAEQKDRLSRLLRGDAA
jgi:hypothetical protein